MPRKTPAAQARPARRASNASDGGRLIELLQGRFETHMHRHKGVSWAKVLARLTSKPGALKSLAAMEASGGEPDVIEADEREVAQRDAAASSHRRAGGAFLFCDCARESPTGRRSLCYDGQALRARKEHKPAGSAVEQAAAIGIELLPEGLYLAMQSLDEYDLKTSSWLATPLDVREHGGALFGDRRFGRVFVYCNGAQSYYAARGFRGVLRV